MFSNTPGGFAGIQVVTLSVGGGIDIFTKKVYLDTLVANLTYCQHHKGLSIFKYVILSNRVVMIARHAGGQLSVILGHFKSYTAKVLIQQVAAHEEKARRDWMLHMFRFYARYQPGYDEHQVWSHHNMPISIDSHPAFDHHAGILHCLPVTEGLVTLPEHWHYSSAHPAQLIQTNKIL